MGVVRSCVFLLLLFVELQHVTSQPIFESLFCDWLCDDDSSDYDFCDGCSSSSSSDMRASTMMPNQNINIKIPASQGTSLDIVNQNGMWSVKVDAQGASPAPSSTTAAATTAAATTAATTAAPKRK